MKNIVIIDDEQSMLDTITTLLEDLDVKCFPFKNGNEALNFIKQKQIDLAIVDLSMPEINGIEIIGKIRELSLNTKTIAMSGMEWKDTLLQGAIIAGANNILKKPFDYQTLYSKIEDIL